MADNTPRTEALARKFPNSGYGLDKQQCITQLLEEYSQLEHELAQAVELLRLSRQYAGWKHIHAGFVDESGFFHEPCGHCDAVKAVDTFLATYEKEIG